MESIDKLISILTQSLDAPTAKLILVALIGISVAILLVAKYFYSENQRRAELFEENRKRRREQIAVIARMQRETSLAMLANLEEAYRLDFEFYKLRITEKKYDIIWAKIPPKFYEIIAKFVYDETLTPEERGARIVQLIRNNPPV